MAEAMCRHTSEVDIHHIGPFAGLGSRHNVKHWGGSAKEARISMAPHHRFYYYLTGDERVGDIMDEVKDADLTTKHADPLRNYYHLDGSEPYSTHARTGPDWSSYCGNWMTRWERFQDTFYRDKMRRGIEGIAAAPYRFLSGTDFGYDPDTGRMYYIGEQSTGGSHLALCMGEPQVYCGMICWYSTAHFIFFRRKKKRDAQIPRWRGRDGGCPCAPPPWSPMQRTHWKMKDWEERFGTACLRNFIKHRSRSEKWNM